MLAGGACCCEVADIDAAARDDLLHADVSGSSAGLCYSFARLSVTPAAVGQFFASVVVALMNGDVCVVV